MISTFPGNINSSELKKITAKLRHVMGRLDRCVPSTEEDRKVKSQLFFQLLCVKSSLRKAESKFKKSLNHPNTSLDLSAVQKTHDETSETDCDSDASTPQHVRISTITLRRINYL